MKHHIIGPPAGHLNPAGYMDVACSARFHLPFFLSQAVKSKCNEVVPKQCETPRIPACNLLLSHITPEEWSYYFIRSDSVGNHQCDDLLVFQDQLISHFQDWFWWEQQRNQELCCAQQAPYQNPKALKTQTQDQPRNQPLTWEARGFDGSQRSKSLSFANSIGSRVSVAHMWPPSPLGWAIVCSTSWSIQGLATLCQRGNAVGRAATLPRFNDPPPGNSVGRVPGSSSPGFQAQLARLLVVWH